MYKNYFDDGNQINIFFSLIKKFDFFMKRIYGISYIKIRKHLKNFQNFKLESILNIDEFENFKIKIDNYGI